MHKISIPVRYDWNVPAPAPASYAQNFNSSKVRLEPTPSAWVNYHIIISIPVRYDWNSYRSLHTCTTLYFNSSKVRLEQDYNFEQQNQEHISIPVRYDWNDIPSAKDLYIKNFNSSKVRLEPCGHKCGLCLCITWLLWQRYDKNREKMSMSEN